VIELDPNYAPTYNSMGYMYKDIENYTDAEKAFQKYIELIPDEANPYDSYAEFLLLQSRYNESIEQYNKSFETDPEFVSALSGIGDNYIFMAEYDKAREYYQQYFDKAFNLNQKMGALFLKATSYVHEGKIDEAIKTFEERTTLANENNSPNYVVFSYLNVEWALDEAGKFEDGEAYLNKADEFIKIAELKEADRNTYKLFAGLYRCYHYIMMGDLESAESDLKTHKQTVEQRQNPNEKQFLNMILGMLETGKKNYEAALTNLAEADKESPYVWFCQAVAQEKAGNKEEAKKLYSKVGACNENGMGLAVVRKKAQDKAKAL
jgi:tetratricopeptide (TPR) repeat protein